MSARLSARLSVALLLVWSGGVVAADVAPAPRKVDPNKPKVPPGFDPEAMADPKAAEAAALWIESRYDDRPHPEAVKMLTAILRGSQMGPGEGWFGPPAGRYGWSWLAARHELGAKAKGLPKADFRGPAALFDQLDRDGDGTITPADLDWSDRNMYVQQSGFVNRIFRRMNRGNDGKLSREEVNEFFDRLAAGKDYVSPDDLRRALLPRGGGGGFAPGDGPSVPTLVKGLFAGEIGSMAEGPKVGDTAPDFTLKTADGTGSVTLSKLIGDKPVVLVTGNFTCGPFRSLYPDVEAVYRRHKDAANFLLVYVREAHPTDGWSMDSNAKAGVAVRQPLTFGERVGVCDQFCRKLKPALPVVVDDIDDPVGTLYSGMPARMYVIDRNGKVAYKSGRGPFGFRPGEMEQALLMALVEAEGK